MPSRTSPSSARRGRRPNRRIRERQIDGYSKGVCPRHGSAPLSEWSVQDESNKDCRAFGHRCLRLLRPYRAGIPSTEEGRSPDRGQSLQKQAIVPTPAEIANYREYTQYEAVVSFLSALQSRAPELGVATVGRSLPTERYGARDIFLAVLGGKGAATPESLDRTKPTVLFTAAQHGNEQSAKEAVLWLLRDLAAGELKPLLAEGQRPGHAPDQSPRQLHERPGERARPRHEPRPRQGRSRGRPGDPPRLPGLQARSDDRRPREGRRLLPGLDRLRLERQHRQGAPGLLAPGRAGRGRAGPEEKESHLPRVSGHRGPRRRYVVRIGPPRGRPRPARGDEAVLHDRPQRRPEQPGHLRDAFVHPGGRLAPRPGDAPGQDRLAVQRPAGLPRVRGRARAGDPADGRRAPRRAPRTGGGPGRRGSRPPAHEVRPGPERA
ncbi:MAG: hypothetical protein M0C28_04175 [Candidatus Moduliflexus flocculans]|nr:hypothetical protein [Candidatus Moduliflexus flocculans]